MTFESVTDVTNSSPSKEIKVNLSDKAVSRKNECIEVSWQLNRSPEIVSDRLFYS